MSLPLLEVHGRSKGCREDRPQCGCRQPGGPDADSVLAMTFSVVVTGLSIQTALLNMQVIVTAPAPVRHVPLTHIMCNEKLHKFLYSTSYNDKARSLKQAAFFGASFFPRTGSSVNFKSSHHRDNYEGKGGALQDRMLSESKRFRQTAVEMTQDAGTRAARTYAGPLRNEWPGRAATHTRLTVSAGFTPWGFGSWFRLSVMNT